MPARALLIALFAAAPMFGQLQLTVLEKVFERAVESQYDLGAAPVGDTLETRFRLRNPGAATVTLTLFEVRGTGFSTSSAPAPGTRLGPGQSVDFTVRFLPTMAVAYSAAIQADGVSAILRASGIAALAVFLEQPYGRVSLSSGSTADFGSIERGATAVLRFRLENQSGGTLTLTRLAVEGSFFRVLTGPAAGAVFAPGESAPLEIAFEPGSSGVWQASLEVDRRRITLAGAATEPPLPEGTLSVELAALRSAQQGRLSVGLTSPARTTGAGSVRMEFRPAAGRSDPAIVFSNGTRTALLTVAEGESAARFGSLPYLAFQTGTTAGTIVFTLQLGGKNSQLSVVIPAAPPGLEKPVVTRAASELELRLSGFDNTRSAGRVSFTFLDRDGNILGSPIQVDQADKFRQYFENSDLGGLFSLRAVFPVSGPTERIDAVEVEVTNSAGAARTERVRF